jgi:seryl-tRNA synthetase
MTRLSKFLLSEIIREVVHEAITNTDQINQQEEEESSEVDTKFQSGVMSTAQRMKQAKDRIKSAGEELDPNEQKIIDQLEAKLTQLASIPGVDMVKHRPLLIRVLKLLVGTVTPKGK